MGIMVLIVALICILNFGISWWNAYVCGNVWEDSKTEGGFIRLLVWCAAIQSALGFSSVYIIVLLLATTALGVVEPDMVGQLWKITLSFWYLAVIFPLLGTGLIITIHSVMEAIRRKDMLSAGIATYNTVAQVSNMYDAYQNVGATSDVAGEAVGSLFSGGDSDDAKAKLALLALMLVLVAVMAGAVTTYLLIQKYASTAPRVLGKGYARA
ncbi:MAG TPA: hypothetical protein VHP58_03095 [Alphaproteobacteria bacterium]|nr:hypothetical protein [Alphaproteobacteria bacterium]